MAAAGGASAPVDFVQLALLLISAVIHHHRRPRRRVHRVVGDGEDQPVQLALLAHAHAALQHTSSPNISMPATSPSMASRCAGATSKATRRRHRQVANRIRRLEMLVAGMAAGPHRPRSAHGRRGRAASARRPGKGRSFVGLGINARQRHHAVRLAAPSEPCWRTKRGGGPGCRTAERRMPLMTWGGMRSLRTIALALSIPATTTPANPSRPFLHPHQQPR